MRKVLLDYLAQEPAAQQDDPEVVHEAVSPESGSTDEDTAGATDDIVVDADQVSNFNFGRQQYFVRNDSGTTSQAGSSLSLLAKDSWFLAAWDMSREAHFIWTLCQAGMFHVPGPRGAATIDQTCAPSRRTCRSRLGPASPLTPRQASWT